MKVKICGITDVDTAVAAARMGADAIGFVFAESKRRIEVEMARNIADRLPRTLFKVGVFVNETIDEIERIASIVGLTHIQLHGDEDASFSASLSLPVIKAWSVQDQVSFKGIIEYPCAYILLDGPKGKYHGGNGTSFDWHSFTTVDLKGKKVILAGGLSAANVEEGIRAIKPDMVDVSSGVETEGKKDVFKIKQFIEKAKGCLIGGKTE